jgi:hypothetical protein
MPLPGNNIYFQVPFDNPVYLDRAIGFTTPPSKASNHIDGDLKPAANTATDIPHASTIVQSANIAFLNPNLHTFSIANNLLEAFNAEDANSWLYDKSTLSPNEKKGRNGPPLEITISTPPDDVDTSKSKLTSPSPKSASSLTPSHPISTDEINISPLEIINTVNVCPDFVFNNLIIVLKPSDHASEEDIQRLFPDAVINLSEDKDGEFLANLEAMNPESTQAYINFIHRGDTTQMNCIRNKSLRQTLINGSFKIMMEVKKGNPMFPRNDSMVNNTLSAMSRTFITLTICPISSIQTSSWNYMHFIISSRFFYAM